MLSYSCAVQAGVLQLITLTGGATETLTGDQWDIDANTSIGRSDDAGITLNLAAVSRSHAAIDVSDGRCEIRDLGSTNGTIVNGKPLIPEQPQPLVDGDELVIAGVVALRFIDPMATPIAPRIGRLTGVWINPETDAVWLDARPVEPPLSERQLALLRQLVDADGAIVSRPDIVANVWADVAADGVSDDAVNAVIKRLRQRLRETSDGADVIDIVRGRGVRLDQSTTAP